MELERLLDDALGAAEIDPATEWLDSSMVFHDLPPAERDPRVEANREAANRVWRLGGWRSCIDAIEAKPSFQRLPHDERLEQQAMHDAICFLGSSREERSPASMTKRAALALAAGFDMGRLKNRMIYMMIGRLCDEAVAQGLREEPLRE